MTQSEPVHFTVRALSSEPFQALFNLSGDELEKRRARQLIADSKPGFPCRVSLQDAEPGEEVILTNFVHLDSRSPFHSSHAIYVRKGATTAAPCRDRFPDMLRNRLLSIRAFDANDMLLSAEVVEGERADHAIQKLFEDSSVRFLHVHFAEMGCYGCRIDRE